MNGRVTSCVLWYAVVCFILLATNQLPAAESVNLDFLPASEALFLKSPESTPLAFPEKGHVLAAGRFDDGAFAIDTIDQITVVAPGGRQVPLAIDNTSIYREFGQIVSLRFYFSVPLSALASAGGNYALKWGPDVAAQNKLVAGLALDPARPTAYRTFSWFRGQEVSVATIKVIADSRADYYSLWYLLPMGLIFVLLTIRKFRADNHDSNRLD